MLGLCCAVVLASAGGCGGGGTPAEPVTVEGLPARLVDAVPCIWNEDSGCTDHRLRRADPWLCVDGATTLELDAGGDAQRVVVTAGGRRYRVVATDEVRPGDVRLRVRRVSDRRFAIEVPADLASDTRALWVRISYAPGVETPYTPAGEMSAGGEPEPFERGIYALRLRTTVDELCEVTA
jgi:hypothetical protein